MQRERYHDNYRSLEDVRNHTKHAWKYWLSKRFSKGAVRWDNFEKVLSLKFPLPRPQILYQFWSAGQLCYVLGWSDRLSNHRANAWGFHETG